MRGAVRLLAWCLAIALVAWPVVGLLRGWFAASRWPVTRLTVQAEFKHVSAAEIRAAVLPRLGKGFFALNLEAVQQAVAALSLAAFDALGCAGWGRVDVMRDRAGRNWLLEVNTAPGMTSHSLVPKAARQIGIGFEDLCWLILESSIKDGNA